MLVALTDDAFVAVVSSLAVSLIALVINVVAAADRDNVGRCGIQDAGVNLDDRQRLILTLSGTLLFTITAAALFIGILSATQPSNLTNRVAWRVRQRSLRSYRVLLPLFTSIWFSFSLVAVVACNSAVQAILFVLALLEIVIFVLFDATVIEKALSE